ncbi:MAG: DUF3943 domain-containing protein [Deltaproteobacteria bacterium]|nr:DUF3943 domain-containing protein [Deltaproteobacteria bacterium]
MAAARTERASPAQGDGRGPGATRRPAWLRGVVEESAALAGGAIWYWLTPDRQLADWDYPSLKQRLTLEAWRFDNNTFATNYLWHAFGGTGFHVFGRSNDLGLWPSVVLGFATSFAWEYLLEFREKVSVNDVVVTTGAGVACGEFAHWLGRYLNGSPRPNHPLRAAARWTLGLFHAVHRAMDGPPPAARPARLDPLGFSADIWHRFSIAYGVVRAGSDGVRGAGGPGPPVIAHQLRLEADLAALPGTFAPGRVRRSFSDGNLTRVRYLGTFDGEDVDTDFYADTSLAGYQLQDIADDGTGRAASFGAGVAFAYRRERLGTFSDRLGLMHLPVLAYDDHVLGRDFRLSFSVRLAFDFAGVEAAAFPLWKERHPDAVEKTILRREGYYYAWGFSGRLSLELVLPLVAVGGGYFGGSYDSIEGLDRSQEEVTVDVEAADRIQDLQAWLRVGPMLSVFFVEGRWARELRASRVAENRADQALERYSVEVRATF